MSIRRVDDFSLSLGGLSLAATGPAGTAHGPAVDLKPRAAAATGGYLVIDQPQANAIMDEMERENAINPITMERPELRASIFRTVARTPKENGDPRYSYWDPAELWRWLQQPSHQGRMPDTNEPAWFEDWWALYYTYGAPAVPSWAYSLEKRNPDTQPSASVREPARVLPRYERRNAVRDRSADRPTLNNDEAASLWERIHGGGGGGSGLYGSGGGGGLLGPYIPTPEELEAIRRNNGGGGGQGPQAAPGSDALAAWRDATSNDLPPPPPMSRTPTWANDGRAFWGGPSSLQEAERRSQARLDSAAAAREEAHHLAEAERYRNAPPGDSFGGSNEQMEAYHRQQAALAAARRAAASANTPPNPFGSM